jgi:hypothetical protein
MYLIPIKEIKIKISNYLQDNYISSLDIFINNTSFLTFPIYNKNINDIIKKFENILLGKDVFLDLTMSEDISNIIKIDKESILFNTIKSINKIHQESYLKFENNNIFRNEIRNFIDNFENKLK